MRNSRFRKWLERITGYRLERFEGKTFALIDQAHRAEAWFSYRSQIRSIIEKYAIDLVIDVGASKGRFARKIRAFYPGEILSFEPVSSVFEQLSAAAAGDTAWRACQLALGSRDSTQSINVSTLTGFSSLLETNEYSAARFGDQSRVIAREIVTVRRLDGLLDEMMPGPGNRRIFIKMDTQGYDMEVFRGLGDKLDQVVAFQSEVSLIPIYQGMPHWTETISMYEQAGFGVVGMFPITRDSGRVIEYDCLMVRVGV
jgi:FkbM family methyltransferase